MHVRVVTIGSALLAAAIVGSIAGCSDGASFAVRMAYLQKMANEGVQTHRLIDSEGDITTMKRCTDAYGGLQDQNPPSDEWGGGVSQDWLNQIQAFYVESCVTGLPKAVPRQSAGTSSGSPVSSVEPSTTPSASSTR